MGPWARHASRIGAVLAPSWSLFSSAIEEIRIASDCSVAALSSEILQRLRLGRARFDARLHRGVRDAKGNLTGIDPAPLSDLDELRSCVLRARDTVVLRMVNGELSGTAITTHSDSSLPLRLRELLWGNAKRINSYTLLLSILV